MKIKKARKVMVNALRHNYRLMWADFCRLPLSQRLVLAWYILRGNPDLDRACNQMKGAGL
jgi:hypothetical protein